MPFAGARSTAGSVSAISRKKNLYWNVVRVNAGYMPITSKCQECRPSDTTYRTNSNQGQKVVIIEQPNQITTVNRGQPELRDELIKTHEKDAVIEVKTGGMF